MKSNITTAVKKKAWWGLAFAACALAGCGTGESWEAPSETSAYFWNHGLQPKNPTFCWVDNAATAYASETDAIEETIAEWQWTSGIRFNFIGNCAAPVSTGNKDFYPGDIRALLQIGPWPDGGKDIPGNGCVDGNGNQKRDNGPLWSSPPDGDHDSCQYNLHLTLNQPRNNYLHESGHAIGLAHEHTRPDATCLPDFWTGGTYITSYYDINSVMHYVRNEPDCTAPGNWGSGGLTAGDMLASEIMYPYSMQSAIFGRTVLSEGEYLDLISDWQKRGANINLSDTSKSMMKQFSWKLGNSVVSTGEGMKRRMRRGNYVVNFRYKDFWDRQYSGSYRVKVLSKKKFKQTVPLAATLGTLFI